MANSSGIEKEPTINEEMKQGEEKKYKRSKSKGNKVQKYT